MPKHQPHPALRRLPVLRDADLASSALNAAVHHLQLVNEIYSSVNARWSSASDRTSVALYPTESNMIIWHTRGFFWELYSVSDLIQQWCNHAFELGLKEEQVTWASLAKVKGPKAKRAEWKGMRSLIQSFLDDAVFFEIKQYRHFSHRSILTFQAAISSNFGLVGVKLEPARIGQLHRELRQQLNEYVEFMKRFGGAAFPPSTGTPSLEQVT